MGNPAGHRRLRLGRVLSKSLSNLSLGDLFLNPQLKSDLAPQGGSLPLGGSTGSPIYLQNADWLDVTIDYSNGSNSSFNYQLENLTSPTDPEPQTFSAPNPVVTNAFTVTDEGQPAATQNGTYPDPWLQGMDLLQVTDLSNPFSSAQFTGQDTQSPVLFVLSDDAGNEWDTSNATHSHNHIYPIDVSSSVVDLYFPPSVTKLRRADPPPPR